jgi:hypothetical protein
VNNKKAFNEFSKILVLTISKILIKTNSNTVVSLLEGVNSGLTVALIKELSFYISDLENKMHKKLVNYALCCLIADYYQSFDQETLVLFTLKLVKHLEQFAKVNKIGSQNMDQLLGEGNQDLSYAANNYNKLINAEVKVKY